MVVTANVCVEYFSVKRMISQFLRQHLMSNVFHIIISVSLHVINNLLL